MNIQKLLLCLYPRTWRARYEEEFLVVLASHPFSLFEGLDVMRGALDAHLHPYLGTSVMEWSERIRYMLSILRRSLLTIFCAYGGFILAGMGFQKMTEYADFQEVARTHSLVGFSFNLVVIGSVVALLAVVAGGLPIIVTVIKSALVRRRLTPLFALAIPVLAFGTFFGILPLLKAVFHPGNQHVLLGRGLFLGTLLTTAIISVGSICFAVARSEISEKLLRFALPPSILATLSMALMSVSTFIWGLGLQESAPKLFTGNDGIVGSSTLGTWLGIVIAMALATTLAVISLVRALSARVTLHKATA